jgi:hypothetical protein
MVRFCFFAIGLMLAGCAPELDVSQHEIQTFEKVRWEERSMIKANDWRSELPDEPNDPCACQSDQCVENWIDENLGCDICVAFSCSNLERDHYCIGC